MAELNWLDFVVIGIIALSTIISIVRGFIREFIALAFVVLAVWVAAEYYPAIAQPLAPYMENEKLRMGVAFAGLFVVVMVIGGIINYVLAGLVVKTGLSGTDRTLGAVFGAARGALLVAVLVLLAGLTKAPDQPWWRSSALMPQFEELANWIRQLLPDDLSWRLGELPPNLLDRGYHPESPKAQEAPLSDVEQAAKETPDQPNKEAP